MAAIIDDNYQELTAKVTVPTETSTAVTITAASGSSLFTLSAEIPKSSGFTKGAWIWDTSNDKLYSVDYLTFSDNKVGYIRGTFANTLSGAAMKYISAQDAKIKELSVLCQSGTVTVNGVTLPPGNSINRDKADNGNLDGTDYCDPVIVNAGSGVAYYQTIK